MVKNPHILEQFELEYERENPMTLRQKFDLFESMYEHARDFGHYDSGRTGSNLDHVVVLARILNEQIHPTSDKNRTSA